ncbi:uncharacterized protein PITG_06985 [Phytophthora infestans T30-4]|uniref:PDZ domain-containing protein n=1 Tax=Phytophthora infestans (strain T30-4) TaxID=403677 RepID=D0N6Z1_PHYIT|nr:uncharacterized protein PITG_06985 [Phytophthora infestans T30-4]EEY53340.1 conserved hypothetical protein [Phytophthora infestans T30-4]|eukprot:XP_002904958.1 conserved hypothetical protein [Phytophthora infestans T30-4]
MASKSQQRQIQVLLTLHDGERSFGMSLAQKSPALGPKYTVVSSVFANSPADRAGVRKGYVLRSINDKPVGGLTVAQVANHFRNVGQARITLEVVESTASPRTSAFTAAATFGGATTLSNRPALQTEAGSNAQRPITPVTGFTAVSSGRAIAAPGSALAVPSLAPPKQPALRLVAKRAAKSLGLQPQSGVFSSTSASVASADAKTASGGNSKRKSVKPVLRLGPKPKSVASEKAEEKVATASSVKTANAPAAVQSTSSAPEVAQPKATTKTGKKRRRPHRKNAAPANGTTNTSNKGKSKAKKASKHHQEKTEMDTFLDDDEMLDLYAFSSDADAEQPPSPSAKAKRRTAKGRRRGGTDRPRHSLTVDRLVGMGFTQEDAEASVKEIGDDPDACMVWIISKIEERQFTADLNQASIQSEQSKRDEEKRVKKLEKEILSNAEKFMALFPTKLPGRTCWSLLDVWTLC